MIATTRSLRARYVGAVFVLIVSMVVWIAWCDAAGAETASQAVRAEEEGELVVSTPDANSDAPQARCVISPPGDARPVHAAQEQNGPSGPEFLPGGLRLQIWDGVAVGRFVFFHRSGWRGDARDLRYMKRHGHEQYQSKTRGLPA